MKRGISICLALILVLTTVLGSMTVYADTEIDETAPVIKSIEILNPDNLNADTDCVQIKLEIIEDGTGVSQITFRFDELDFDWRAEENGLLYTGVHTLSIPLKGKLSQDKHTLTYLVIQDANDLWNDYDMEEMTSDFGLVPSINVVASSWIDTGVYLTSFRLLKTKDIDASGYLPVELTFETKGEVTGIYLSFYDAVSYDKYGQISYDCTSSPLTSGTYTIDFPIENNLEIGSLTLSAIGTHGTTDCYFDKWSDPDFFEEPQTIEVTKEAPRKLPLELLDYEVLNHNISTPGLLEMNLSVDTHGDSFDEITVVYETTSGRQLNFFGEPVKLAEGKYYTAMPISPFVTEGEIILRCIVIRDKDDECFNWYWDDEYPELLSKGSVFLESGYDITYFGSLGNGKVVSVLKEMKSGETAVLDCRNKKKASKAIFEAIAGRDITVAFIDEYVQWVFNGKNIKIDRCKDIDLTSEIDVVSGTSLGFSDDKKIAKLIFKNNGELPGEVDMRINYDYLAVKYKFPKNNLTLSYHEPKTDNVIIEDTDVDMAEDKYYEYEVDHNSTFILSKGRAKIGYTTVSVVQKNEDSIKIKWKKKAGNGYYIYRSTKKDGTYNKIATIKGNSTLVYKDSHVKSGKIYYYKVRPYSKNKTFNKTAVISKPCKAYTKIGKTTVTAVPNGLNSVKIKWQKKSGNGYYVYRSTKKNSDFTRIATVKGNAKTSYVDKDVKQGKTYYYRVKPYSSIKTFSKTAKMSDACKAYTRLKAPKIDTCRKVKNKLRVRVEWYGIKDAKYYEVYRSTAKNGTYKKVYTEKKSGSNYYIDQKVKKGKTYYYKIKAIYKKNSKYNSKLGAYKSVIVK